MNAYLASSELALLPANRVSYPAARKPPTASLFSRIAGFWHRQSVLHEMAKLSDHELHDVGLSRADIDHVFDEGFTRQR